MHIVWIWFCRWINKTIVDGYPIKSPLFHTSRTAHRPKLIFEKHTCKQRVAEALGGCVFGISVGNWWKNHVERGLTMWADTKKKVRVSSQVPPNTMAGMILRCDRVNLLVRNVRSHRTSWNVLIYCFIVTFSSLTFWGTLFIYEVVWGEQHTLERTDLCVYFYCVCASVKKKVVEYSYIRKSNWFCCYARVRGYILLNRSFQVCRKVTALSHSFLKSPHIPSHARF